MEPLKKDSPNVNKETWFCSLVYYYLQIRDIPEYSTLSMSISIPYPEISLYRGLLHIPRSVSIVMHIPAPSVIMRKLGALCYCDANKLCVECQELDTSADYKCQSYTMFAHRVMCTHSVTIYYTVNWWTLTHVSSLPCSECLTSVSADSSGTTLTPVHIYTITIF